MIDNLADPSPETNSQLNERLHSSNILAYKKPRTYKPPPNSIMSGWFVAIGLPMAEDAQRVCDLYNRTMLNGNRLHVYISRIAMEHLGGVSADRGRLAGHGLPRDLGSAVRTNFETVGRKPTLMAKPYFHFSVFRKVYCVSCPM
jgi:hypothetical protein